MLQYHSVQLPPGSPASTQIRPGAGTSPEGELFHGFTARMTTSSSVSRILGDGQGPRTSPCAPGPLRTPAEVTVCSSPTGAGLSASSRPSAGTHHGLHRIPGPPGHRHRRLLRRRMHQAIGGEPVVQQGFGVLEPLLPRGGFQHHDVQLHALPLRRGEAQSGESVDPVFNPVAPS